MISIDGNLVDMTSAIVGMASCLIRPARRWHKSVKPFFRRDKLINDVLNGAMIVPFGFMLVSVFSQKFMDMLISSAKFTMFLGGAVGLTFVLGELFKGKP